MADSKSSDNKIFDVAKPGGADTPIGSKPMVIGHSFMQNDPTLTAPDLPSKTATQRTEQKEAVEAIKAPAKKIVLQPISHIEEAVEPQVDNAKPAADAAVADEVASDDKSEQKPADDTSPANELGKPADNDEKSSEETAKTVPVQTAEERSAQIESLIDSKQYFVNIKQQSNSSNIMNSKLAYIAVIILLLIGIIVALDSGLLDIGVDLPFDLL